METTGLKITLISGDIVIAIVWRKFTNHRIYVAVRVYGSLCQIKEYISMVYCKTAVIILLAHWSYVTAVLH